MRIYGPFKAFVAKHLVTYIMQITTQLYIYIYTQERSVCFLKKTYLFSHCEVKLPKNVQKQYEESSHFLVKVELAEKPSLKLSHTLRLILAMRKYCICLFHRKLELATVLLLIKHKAEQATSLSLEDKTFLKNPENKSDIREVIFLKRYSFLSYKKLFCTIRIKSFK